MNVLGLDGKITAKQAAFIAGLSHKKSWQDTFSGEMCRVVKLCRRLEMNPNDNDLEVLVNDIPRKFASKTIDALIACKIIVQSAPATSAALKTLATQLANSTTALTEMPTELQQDKSTYDQVIELLQTIPLSKYAIKNDKGEWEFYEVKKIHKTGKIWPYKLIGSPGSWKKIYQGASSPATLALLQKIKKNPWQAAQDYTSEYKECAACGAKLSHGKSVAQGFGPICVKKFKPFM